MKRKYSVARHVTRFPQLSFSMFRKCYVKSKKNCLLSFLFPDSKKYPNHESKWRPYNHLHSQTCMHTTLHLFLCSLTRTWHSEHLWYSLFIFASFHIRWYITIKQMSKIRYLHRGKVLLISSTCAVTHSFMSRQCCKITCNIPVTK